MLAHLAAFVLSLTFLFCIINFLQKCTDGFCEDTHFWRGVFSIIMSLVIPALGLKLRSLNWTGALAGIFVGLIHTISNYSFMASLLTFFYTSSKATRFRSEKKRKLEADFKEGGQRSWHQVMCNGATSTEMALLFLLYGGPGEIALDFENNYLGSWLAAAVLSALAGANGDTWASEIGTVIAEEEPVLITSMRKVPVGTNGGVTRAGLSFSALGGALVGLAYFLVLLLSVEKVNLFQQAFLLIFIGASAGFFGSLLDSLMGATLQYSGLDMKTSKVVERPGIGVKHISGKYLLSNHSVNMSMTIIISIIVPTVSAILYKYFV